MYYYELMKKNKTSVGIEFVYCTENELVQCTRNFNPETIQEIPEDQYYKKLRNNITLDIHSIIKDN